MKKVWIIVVVVVVLGAGFFLLNQESAVVVTNFDECVAAGNPVMESYPEQCVHDGVTYARALPGKELLRQVVSAVQSGDKGALGLFIQFGQFPCTTRDGLGGPPKCMTGEADGTIIEALPVIEGEGTHIRKGSVDPKTIVKEGAFFGAYRVTDAYYSDADFPKGEYAIIVKHDAPIEVYSILHVTGGKIVRVDGRLGELSLTGLEPIEVGTTPTSADDAPPGSIHNLPVPEAVAAVKKHVAEKSGVREGLVIVMTAYEKEWSDGCLGLGGPAESCIAVITPGYEVTVQVKGAEQKYRTNADGSQIRMEK